MCGGGRGGNALVHRNRRCAGRVAGRVVRADWLAIATIWCVLTGADAAVVDAVIGAWLAERSVETLRPETARFNAGDDVALVAIAVDGKTVRGATDTEGNQVYLLAVATHKDALVLGQVQVGAKSNEIPMFAPLLETTRASPPAPSPSLVVGAEVRRGLT